MNKFVRAVLLTLLWLCSSLAVAQQPDLEQLDQHIEKARQEWNVPGLAVAIVKDDSVILAKGYGVRKLGAEDMVDADTLFAIASNSKAFTAAALAMLVEEKKLAWDDRVRDHLPYLQLDDVYTSAELRIDDLLCHRSGLGTFSGDLLWYGTGYSPEQILRRTRYLPATGRFRADYGYSNLMFLAAGEVVTAASGQPWADFVRQRFFEPLEMERTTTSVSQLESLGNYAIPHKPTTEHVTPIDWYNWDSMAAAGGIISSVNDMTKWIAVQLRHGRIDDQRRLFSEDSARHMWSPQTIIPIGASTREQYPSTHFRAYGLGWVLSDYKGRLTVSHGGGYDGMYSRVMLVPEEQLGIVVLTNSMTGISTALSNHIVDAYLGGDTRDWNSPLLKQDQENRRDFEQRIAKAIEKRAEDTRPSHPLNDYQGSYGGPLYGDATITVEEDQLVLRLLPNPDLVADLTHLHYDTFVVDWRHQFAWFDKGTIQFVMNSAGEITEFKLDVPNDDLWFYELEFKRK